MLDYAEYTIDDDSIKAMYSLHLDCRSMACGSEMPEGSVSVIMYPLGRLVCCIKHLGALWTSCPQSKATGDMWNKRLLSCASFTGISVWTPLCSRMLVCSRVVSGRVLI